MSHPNLGFLIAMAAALAAPAFGEPLALNEDDSHFFMSRTPEEMSIEGLNAFIDQYAGTQVNPLLLCPNAMKASYRSQVWDAIWDLDGQRVKDEETVAQRWISNARLLNERGLDPYAVWIARCREKHLSPWLSMRMNDVHNADDPQSYIHSHFWVRHPEYWRVPNSTSGSWVERALNYAIPEVREHQMQFVRELLERYDCDGLELDWMRFGYHFAPGQEKEGAAILTQFMREARALAQASAAKRNHPIKVGARVPTHPDAALGLGMDAETWVREGLVDQLVLTPFWATTDFDIPIELWRDRLGDSAAKVVIAAGAEILLRAHPGAHAIENDLASARGFAAAAWHRGADQIYLFNYMDKEPMQGPPGTYRALLEQGLGREECLRHARRHIVTYRDTVAPGMDNGAVLPLGGFKGTPVRLYIGPAPKTGSAILVAGLGASDTVPSAGFEAFVNGTACVPLPDAHNPAQWPDARRALQWSCPLGALKDGYNEVRLPQRPGAPEEKIVWMELRLVP